MTQFYGWPSRPDEKMKDVLEWIIRNGRGTLVDYRLYPPARSSVIRDIAQSGETAGGLGDGSPFVPQAVDLCWGLCQNLQKSITSVTNPNVISSRRIHAETGVTADANPYFGLTRGKLEAVIRAAYHSAMMPEVLLSIWAKEGSQRMVTAPRQIPQATTARNAKTIFRCQVYYVDLGADHFILTTRQPGGDNVWDDKDSAAGGHETHFCAKVRELAASRDLSADISAAINDELLVSPTRPFSVTPTVKFYALSLLLVDALFSRMQRNSYREVNSLSIPLNYMQWNMGTASFGRFLASADNHRCEKAYLRNGEPMQMEQWALHTIPKPHEWQQPRVNAIKFMHYMDSYNPIFQPAINLIKPGIEDLRLPGNVG